MQEEIMLREMRDEDYEAIEEIISETWNYDQLTTPQAARKMAKAYLYGCLANQTYKQVAICDKTVAGVIMGKNIRHHRCPLKIRLNQIRAVARLLLDREGRRVSSIFSAVNEIDGELLKESGKDYQGEVAFFAIRSKFRGRGLGKKMFCSLTDYFKAEGINEFFLYTDTTCNYPFYEHQKMHRRAQRTHAFQIEGQEVPMTFFLYDGLCREMGYN